MRCKILQKGGTKPHAEASVEWMKKMVGREMADTGSGTETDGESHAMLHARAAMSRCNACAP